MCKQNLWHKQTHKGFNRTTVNHTPVSYLSCLLVHIEYATLIDPKHSPLHFFPWDNSHDIFLDRHLCKGGTGCSNISCMYHSHVSLICDRSWLATSLTCLGTSMATSNNKFYDRKISRSMVGSYTYAKNNVGFESAYPPPHT